MVTKLGKSISGLGGYVTHELLNANDEVIGYVIFNPSGIAVSCSPNKDDALVYIDECIKNDQIGAEQIKIEPPKG